MFTKQFFAEELGRLVAEYAREHGGSPPAVYLHTKANLAVKVKGQVTAHAEYVVADFALGTGQQAEERRAVIPYRTIVAVTFGPDDSDKGRIGFKP